MGTNPLVSIIIVNWNRKNDLERCLELVFNQDYKNREVIVVDNNSDDGSVEMIRQKFPKTIVFADKKNLGACIAKNNGLKISKGEYIWFLDNDSFVLNKKTLSSMVGLALRNNFGGIGGEAWMENNSICGIKRRKLLMNGESIHEDTSFNQQFFEEDYLSTANFFVKKDVLNFVGFFNPIYFYLYEDADMSFRIKKIGLNLIATPETLIHHAESKDSSRITNFFRINKNRIIFVFMNFNPTYFFILPILDFIYLFHPKKFSILREKSSSRSEKSGNFFLSVIKFGSNYLQSIFLAYAWVFLHLGKLASIKKIYSPIKS